MRTVRIWDPAVRIFHWSLAAGIATAWFSGDDARWLHEPVGYVAAGLVAFRLIWGLIGPHYARFSQFVPSLKRGLGYIGDILKGRERRYLGHNPAGAMMILAILACVSAVALTGWMQTTDAYFGEEWVEELHEFLANGLILLVCLHVTGVVVASLRHRENLVRAMITGNKRVAEAGDVV